MKQAYGHYDVQLVISPGAQFSDERDERELLFLCLYMCTETHAFLLGLGCCNEYGSCYVCIHMWRQTYADYK